MFRLSLAFRPETADRPAAPPLGLALQGGGAYGAFAWGVLDRLLEEDRLPLGGISGASAGAVNAAMLAHGLLEGGRDGAREALSGLWSTVARMAFLSPLGLPGGGLQVDLMTRMLSPYQFNPLNLNPIRDMLRDLVDFERIRRESPFPLMISATNVRTGQPRIFREHELSVDVLMASTCIPALYQAVEIEGETYWDGGFSANPPILPLALETEVNTILVVALMPEIEPDPPTNAQDIAQRMRRIMFNAPLQRDLDALAALRTSLAGLDRLPARLKRTRDLTLETIALDHTLIADGSALDPRPDFLSRLFEAGRARADFMLAGNGLTLKAG